MFLRLGQLVFFNVFERYRSGMLPATSYTQGCILYFRNLAAKNDVSRCKQIFMCTYVQYSRVKKGNSPISPFLTREIIKTKNMQKKIQIKNTNPKQTQIEKTKKIQKIQNQTSKKTKPQIKNTQESKKHETKTNPKNQNKRTNRCHNRCHSLQQKVG